MNPVLVAMFEGRVGVPLSESNRRDALRMYTDEAYHTLVAFDLSLQVEQTTGIADTTRGLPGEAFVAGLNRLIHDAGREDMSHLYSLLFVIVSETLISGNLRDVASAGGMPEAVGFAMGDHARDEGRHHAFFRRYLFHLWSSLNAAERRQMAAAVPAMISLFFAPEVNQVRNELTLLKVRNGDIDDAIDAAYSNQLIQETNRASSASLLRYLHQLDAFADAEVEDEFMEHGLL